MGESTSKNVRLCLCMLIKIDHLNHLLFFLSKVDVEHLIDQRKHVFLFLSNKYEHFYFTMVVKNVTVYAIILLF